MVLINITTTIPTTLWQEYPSSSSTALDRCQLLDHQVPAQPNHDDYLDDCHYGGTLDDDFDGDGDGEDDSDLHGEHEGGEPVVASDVETCGRVGEQQLHHFHLIVITLMLLLQLTLMLLMMMLLMMMIHLPTASSIHQRNATKAVSVI